MILIFFNTSPISCILKIESIVNLKLYIELQYISMFDIVREYEMKDFKEFVDVIAYTILAVSLMTIVALTIFAYKIYNNNILSMLMISVAMFIPLASTLIVNALITKRNLSEFGIKRGKITVFLIIISVVYPFLILLISIPLAYIVSLIPGTNIKIDLTLSYYSSLIKEQAYRLNIPYEILLLSAIFGMIITPFFNAIFAFGEEAGWRGFLLTRLEEELGRWHAIIATGIIWGVWHWPLILLFGYDYPGTHSNLWPFCALLFLLFTIGLGIFLAWLRYESDSVIFPSIAHGSINANLGLGVFMIITNPIIGFPAGIISSTSAIIVGVLVFYLSEKFRA